MLKYSLRYQLVLPFVLLMFLVPTGFGWMLYDAGTQAVNTLTRRVLLDLVQQINSAAEHNLTTAVNTLNAFAPSAADTKFQPFPSDMPTLEKRAWRTNQLISQSGNYVYFGGADGRFLGLYHINNYLNELYLRHPNAPKRRIYGIKRSGERPALLRTDAYDPRVRPWYVTASNFEQPVWSAVYNDFTSGKPTITRAISIRDTRKAVIGVAAVDVELHTLADVLKNLTISQNGVAFVMDSKGFLVASSEQDPSFELRDGKPVALHVSKMQISLIKDSYATVLDWKNRQLLQGGPMTTELETNNGAMNVAASTVGIKQGVDWVTVVVAPRSDFLANITSSFNRGLLIAGFCVFASLILGMIMLNRVLRDIYTLNDAARKIGEGEILPPLHIARNDELGQLARTFNEMEHNLRTDKLTGTFNREFLYNKIRLIQRQQAEPSAPRQHFALMFIDLDDFKSVNDKRGHDAGDRVLTEIASRLIAATRATDTVVRYGGDEFVVLLSDMNNAENVFVTEEKIRAIVSAPIPLDQGDISIGISIGWALFPQDGSNAEKLLKVADERMFDEKKTRKASRA